MTPEQFEELMTAIYSLVQKLSETNDKLNALTVKVDEHGSNLWNIINSVDDGIRGR